MVYNFPQGTLPKGQQIGTLQLDETQKEIVNIVVYKLFGS
jgi:hypothetical protein